MWNVGGMGNTRNALRKIRRTRKDDIKIHLKEHAILHTHLDLMEGRISNNNNNNITSITSNIC